MKKRSRDPTTVVVERAWVVLTTHVSRLIHVLSKIANMSQRNTSGSGAGTRWFNTLPHIVHAADVVKVTRKLEESHLAGTGCQIAVTLFLLGTLPRRLGLLNAADRLRAEERRPGPDPRC